MTPSDFFESLAGLFRAIRPAPEPVQVLPRRPRWSTILDMGAVASPKQGRKRA